jgi:hypothetical protein
MLANLLPIPGGIGGVEGGMVGALLAFGVAGGPSVLGVLAYRALAFWLPIIPGALAYVGVVRTVREWERRRALLLGEVEVAEDLAVAHADRRAEEAAHRRVAGREAE